MGFDDDIEIKITHNKMMPFDTKEVIIKWANLVKTYEAFRWKMIF